MDVEGLNTKFKYTADAGYLTTPFTSQYLSDIAQGDTASERTGNAVDVKGIAFSYTTRLDGSASASFPGSLSSCYVYLVRDKSPDPAAGPTDLTSLIWYQPTSYVAEPLQNPYYEDRFDILYSRYMPAPDFTPTYDGSGAEWPSTYMDDSVFIDLSQDIRRTRWSNDNSGYTDCTQNAYLLYVFKPVSGNLHFTSRVMLLYSDV